MKRIVADERVVAFLGEKLGKGFCPPYAALGIEKDGQIIAGAMFNVFEKPDVHVTVAGHGWTREFLQEVGAYVFGTLGYERITAITESPFVAQIGERLGGEIEGVLRSHFGKGRDAFVIGILKDEYLYGRKEN